MTTPKGFQVAGVHCGLKKDNALDFALIVSDRPCVTAGVFTTNKVKAAPLLVDMEHLERNPDGIRAVAVNSGIANACTGQQGIDNAREMARMVAERIGCAETEVLVLSTGVIGPQLPMEKIQRGVDLAVDSLGDDWQAAATAIMTTDTHPKLATAGHITGMSKGAGMIAPDMATMLGLLMTEAAIPQPRRVHELLKAAADVSFNRIVVDGDTSTNDTVLLLANGAAEANMAAFDHDLTKVCQTLAREIVRDGEGATKLITIDVTGATSDADAHRIANTIASSPLVKTAFYGNDANWGRILAAAGRAGVEMDPDALTLVIGPTNDDRVVQLVKGGMPQPYSETEAAAVMQCEEITVRLDCGAGAGAATVWTCDLSHEYVSINADYRT